MGTPARGYTRTHAPFGEGNEVAVTHGAYSPRRVDPLATVMVDGLLELVVASPDLGYLAKPEFRPAVWAWARTEARVQLLVEYLLDRDLLTAKGKPAPALKLLQREEASAASRRRDLGLDPLSRARLGRDVAAASIDVARLWSERERDADEATEAPLRIDEQGGEA